MSTILYMRITKLPYFILLFFSTLCFSQNYSIQGLLQDENNQPIAFANAILVDLDDINIIKGTITDELGNFTLDNLKSGDYILKISFLGFKEYTTRVELDRNIDFEIITLNETPQELNGVTVIAKRPVVKRLVDRIVFNVENSTLSNNNVLDVLKHTPGVLISNDKITIKNTTPIVYINDRKVHLSIEDVQQLLEGTPANNIKSIEVITSPPAKYEAEGGAVLNIVTSKNIIAGYNGSIFGNYKQGSKFPKYSLGTSHFFKAKKLNTYINYNINPREDFKFVREDVSFIENAKTISSWESLSEERSKSVNQNLSGNIDYNINENNRLGFSTNLLIKPRANTRELTDSETEVFNSNKVLDSSFNSKNNQVEEVFNLAFTLDYLHEFKRLGDKLSANIHHTSYDFSSFQNVSTNYLLPDDIFFRNNKFQTFSSQVIKLYTGQLDYELPISDLSQFETGLKVSNINSQNILDQFSFENDLRKKDLENSDTFLYDETNYAVYTSYSKDWSSWSFKSGLRIEYTDISGNSLSTNQINNNEYFKVFPSFYLKNNLNDSNEIYFKYNKRIYRPRYSQLNPFKYFLNDNAYITGDPNLKPQIDDSFTLGYTFKKDYTFELYYRYENNPAIQVLFQDNENNKLTYRHTNIDRSISYGLDFMTYTKVLSEWNLYVLSSLYYYDEQFIALESNNELLSNDKWSVYAQIFNYFTFLKDKSLIANISFLFISRTVSGPTDISSKSGLDINIKKTLWNNKGSISFGVTDIFNDLNENQYTKYLNQDILTKLRPESRLITIGFNYKFGNFKLTTNKKNIDLIERERLGDK
ncbi:outer membrane beta-barrel protein [Thalassobellus suaedae]|uniref:Outer membrane beta-barrel family protein n=1 Tax=Thalassobellus suaedae TaxID=3074124 RepID=A0ABY9Y2Z9_9FLAO|nr:outer membrane beta-barrel family protein [Flavobacteriaceae bacterium HL-DH10]